MAKMGKGYSEGRPIGAEAGQCHECNGTIISIKMNTSRKGFETTSEKVCKECGLVEGGPFMIMESHTPSEPHEMLKHHVTQKEEDLALRKYYNDNGEELYTQRQISKDRNGNTLLKRDDIPKPTGRPKVVKTYYDIDYDYYWSSHDYWVKDNCCPTYEPDISTEKYKEGEEPQEIKDTFEWTNDQINLSHKLHLNKPNMSVLNNRPKEDVAEYERIQQFRVVEAIASDMQMNKLQVEKVKYVLDEYPNILNIQRYSYEEIIEHLCLYVISFSTSYQRMGGIIKNFVSTTGYNKTLYNVIRQKLDKETI